FLFRCLIVLLFSSIHFLSLLLHLFVVQFSLSLLHILFSILLVFQAFLRSSFGVAPVFFLSSVCCWINSRSAVVIAVTDVTRLRNSVNDFALNMTSKKLMSPPVS